MTSTHAPQRLLMVMPYQQLVRKAVEAGFSVWSIWDPALQKPEYLDQVAEHSEELLLTDFKDVAGLRALVAETARRNAIDVVLHLGNEDTMPPVLAEAQALGLARNSPEAVERVNNKALMRELLNAHGLSVVAAREVPTADAALAEVTDDELPVIVKPAGLSGSRGVALIRARADLLRWAEHVRAAGHEGPFLVEEYLQGPEYSVETLTVNGTHHLMGVTAKQTTGAPEFIETGHVFPAPIPEADAAALSELTLRLLDLTGYAFGPAHTEIIMTAQGPRIVESQTRLGGDRIPVLVDIASGYDLESAVFRALAGQPVEPPKPQRTGAIGFFRLPPGRVESVTGPEEIRDLPAVHTLHFPFGPGDVLPEPTDSFTRHGFVIVGGDTPEEAAAAVAEAQDLLRPVIREDAGDSPDQGGNR